MKGAINNNTSQGTSPGGRSDGVDYVCPKCGKIGMVERVWVWLVCTISRQCTRCGYSVQDWCV